MKIARKQRSEEGNHVKVEYDRVSGDDGCPPTHQMEKYPRARSILNFHMELMEKPVERRGYQNAGSTYESDPRKNGIE